MRHYLLFFLGILLAFILAALNNALYTVNEVEQVIITQFGRPVGNPITGGYQN